MSDPVRLLSEEGGVRRIVLDRPPANILDLETFGAIRRAVARTAGDPDARLLVFEGAGANFSFGASVAEHLPEKVGELLPAFRTLLVELEASGIPTASVVRGQCLGGGLELAAWCGRVFCDPGARFAVPEIRLAVFPPIAAILLPWRVGGPAATQMIVSGASVDGESAARSGLADACSPDPDGDLRRWADETLAPKSALALRFAWRAARRPLARALDEDLPALEKIYLDELMRRRDPVEGLRAFLEKRPPRWENR
ncbi:MAG TPA: enoyl-CoA hydratase/isomerase family protein [Thermoanaerobaculia bacterium]|nr:enoyl-CoA hydratase/isomerase family protein [Thermoanaerobaculia bacterium]